MAGCGLHIIGCQGSTGGFVGSIIVLLFGFKSPCLLAKNSQYLAGNDERSEFEFKYFTIKHNKIWGYLDNY